MIAVKIFYDLEFVYEIKTTPEQRQDYINEIKEAIKSSDSTIKLGVLTFRIINEKDIQKRMDTICDQLDIPSWIAIDWTETVQNFLNATVHGNHLKQSYSCVLHSNGYYICEVN